MSSCHPLEGWEGTGPKRSPSPANRDSDSVCDLHSHFKPAIYLGECSLKNNTFLLSPHQNQYLIFNSSMHRHLQNKQVCLLWVSRWLETVTSKKTSNMLFALIYSHPEIVKFSEEGEQLCPNCSVSLCKRPRYPCRWSCCRQTLQ